MSIPLPAAVGVLLIMLAVIVEIVRYFFGLGWALVPGIPSLVFAIWLLRAIYRAPVAAEKMWDHISFRG